MRCAEVVTRLNKERNWEVNKSQLLYYDTQGVVRPKRDKFLRRDYSEADYIRLKWAVNLSRSNVSIPAIKEILALDKDIMTLTAQALKEKSKTDWLTAEEIIDKMRV